MPLKIDLSRCVLVEDHDLRDALRAVRMQPYQERVVAEHAENKGRLDKLTRFLVSDTFITLPQAERDRLVRQAHLMTQLSDVLAERIAALPPASA